jgi:hypothetical protein
MDIGNDTDSKAIVKVSSGGAGAEGGKPRRLTFNQVQGPAWQLPPGETVKLPRPASYPVTVFFQIEERENGASRRRRKREIQRQVQAQAKRLTLTKVAANGFTVKIA